MDRAGAPGIAFDNLGNPVLPRCVDALHHFYL